MAHKYLRFFSLITQTLSLSDHDQFEIKEGNSCYVVAVMSSFYFPFQYILNGVASQNSCNC